MQTSSRGPLLFRFTSRTHAFGRLFIIVIPNLFHYLFYNRILLFCLWYYLILPVAIPRFRLSCDEEGGAEGVGLINMGLSGPDSNNPHRVTGQRPWSRKGWKSLETQSFLLRLLLEGVNAFGRKSFFRRVTVPRWRKRLWNLSHSDWHKVGGWIKIPHQYVW